MGNSPLEQLTLNQRVQGSSPCAPTNKINSLHRNKKSAHIELRPRGNSRGSSKHNFDVDVDVRDICVRIRL
jgi:hypothetical protein